ncbi:MAG: di-heme oxidoredictase family protein [Verrucomicrobiota bacterium]|nr:di-heme oxidoredictase family protein [Verrucomicrobiota bacterium]
MRFWLLILLALPHVRGNEFSGGATTVFDASRNAFTFPARNMPPERKPAFFVGNSFFNENWVAAPASTVARDGLGPLFNARSCSACHFKDGRGRPPEPGEAMVSMLLRISTTNCPDNGPSGDVTYGLQIQPHALPRFQGEADLKIEYHEIDGSYADGEPYRLRKPVYQFEKLHYGPISTNIQTSGRVAPALIGLGLLEAIPESVLQQLADPDDRDGNGISGKLNIVLDVQSGRKTIGRFGWKAEQPSLRQQIAAAFLGDMGLTTPLFKTGEYTAAQSILSSAPDGGVPEVSEKIFNDMIYYCQTLAVPARRETKSSTILRGEALFRQASCTACHLPELVTGTLQEFPELSQQAIQPFTDLLLHDMGEGLADDRPVFQASGREWRTPPLWGIGLQKTVNGHEFFLHDGRARGLAEAILWHGGEAAPSREAFRQMSKTDREALLEFLRSL